MIEGDWVAAGVPARTPIVPGHEVVGTVAAVGDGVNWLHAGERVGVHHCGRPVVSANTACPGGSSSAS